MGDETLQTRLGVFGLGQKSRHPLTNKEE